jgi:hypothetical protein
MDRPIIFAVFFIFSLMYAEKSEAKTTNILNSLKTLKVKNSPWDPREKADSDQDSKNDESPEQKAEEE